MEHGEIGNRKKRDKKRIGGLVLSFVLSFILLMSVYYIVVNQHITQDKTRYGYIAANESDHIMTTVDGIMARTNTLKALVQDHRGGTDFFDAVAADVYDAVLRETGVALKNLAIAPRGVVSHVYPREGNKALIDFNYFDPDKQGNAEAIEAYEKGETVLTNPFPLVQGGIGMAGRTPVLLTVGDEPQLWGIVAVTIDYERLIDALKLNHLESMGIDYALSYRRQGRGPCHEQCRRRRGRRRGQTLQHQESDMGIGAAAERRMEQRQGAYRLVRDLSSPVMLCRQVCRYVFQAAGFQSRAAVHACQVLRYGFPAAGKQRGAEEYVRA